MRTGSVRIIILHGPAIRFDTKWPVAEILVGSLRPSTPLAASKMLDAGPDCDCAFLLARERR